jgi:hypothetical protein
MAVEVSKGIVPPESIGSQVNGQNERHPGDVVSFGREKPGASGGEHLPKVPSSSFRPGTCAPVGPRWCVVSSPCLDCPAGGSC